jgi:hypothetical protein
VAQPHLGPDPAQQGGCLQGQVLVGGSLQHLERHLYVLQAQRLLALLHPRCNVPQVSPPQL